MTSKSAAPASSSAARQARLVEGRARLDGELVDRQVAGAKGQRIVELGAPGADRLARAGVDEVEREAPAARPGGGHGAPRLGRRVVTPQEGERGVVQGLDAEGQAIDAGRDEVLEAGRCGRRRVGLQGHLEIGRRTPMAMHGLDHGADGGGLHERRRAAAEEEAGKRAPPGPSAMEGELGQKGSAPAPLVDGSGDVGVEVAVWALGQAEGPVDVDGEGLSAVHGDPGGQPGPGTPLPAWRRRWPGG